MGELRQRQFNIVVGVKRAGKSTFLANKVVKPYQGNVIVLKHLANINDPAFEFLPEKTKENWRQGAKPGTPVKCKFGIMEDNYAEHIIWAKEHYKNGLFIVDDCTIFEDAKLSRNMRFFAAMCRHVGIDLWLVYHGMTKLPIEQFVFVDHFIVFNTTDNILRKKNTISEYQQFEKAIKQAKQNYSHTDPKIKYKPAIIKMA